MAAQGAVATRLVRDVPQGRALASVAREMTAVAAGRPLVGPKVGVSWGCAPELIGLVTAVRLAVAGVTCTATPATLVEVPAVTVSTYVVLALIAVQVSWIPLVTVVPHGLAPLSVEREMTAEAPDGPKVGVNFGAAPAFTGAVPLAATKLAMVAGVTVMVCVSF